MFDHRIKKLQKTLIREKLDAYLVSSTANIFYLTGADVFSEIEREAYILVTKRSTYLFTDMRYLEGLRGKLPNGLRLTNTSDFFKTIKRTKAKDIGFEKNLTYAEFARFKKETNVKLKLASPLVEDLRLIKSETEIALLRSAARLTNMTYIFIVPKIIIGVTELEIADLMVQFIKANGGALAFDTIVAFGENSAIPHHKTSGKKLAKKDEFILLDFGAKYKNYSSDMTRTILRNSPSRRAKLLYEAVYQAQSVAANKIEAGELELAKITHAANSILTGKKFPEIPHGLGHGIGIEVHEGPVLSPKSKTSLESNMVFTIEPGIYIPGFGGVRIEDDFLFSKGKLEQLTMSPK